MVGFDATMVSASKRTGNATVIMTAWTIVMNKTVVSPRNYLVITYLQNTLRWLPTTTAACTKLCWGCLCYIRVAACRLSIKHVYTFKPFSSSQKALLFIKTQRVCDGDNELDLEKS